MAVFRGIYKFSEKFVAFKNGPVILRNGWNMEVPFSIKKLDFPLPPKRPLTAYMLFCKEKRQDLRKENPSLSNIEQIKRLAAEWSELPVDMKKPYQLSARDLTSSYGEEHKKYYESLTEEQKKEIARVKAEKRETRRLLRLKKALRESGIPKSPTTAYALFIKMQAKDSSLKGPGELFRKGAEEWKNLSESEKKNLIEQAQKDKIRFNSEMEKWRRKMTADGNVSLLQKYDELKKKGKSLDAEDTPEEENKEAKSKQTKK